MVNLEHTINSGVVNLVIADSGFFLPLRSLLIAMGAGTGGVVVYLFAAQLARKFGAWLNDENKIYNASIQNDFNNNDLNQNNESPVD